jgi:calpain-15
MWALLYEKALAKHRGGYGHLDAGSASKAFKLFNSHPVASLLRKNQKWIRSGEVRSEILEMREQIKSFMTLEYILTAAILQLPHEPFPILTGTGLLDMHMYSVLRIAEVRIDGETSPIVLIKVRNPWGKAEWTGDWSDLSDKWWKFDVAEKLKHQPRNDGIFWMALDEFLKYFNVIDVSCTILKTTCANPQRKLATTIIQVKP